MNKKEFDKVYKQYNEEIFLYLLSRSENREDALDITADTFIAVWHSFDNYRGDASIRTWVYAIAKNKLYGYYSLKKKKHENETFLDEERDYIEKPDKNVNESFEKTNMLFSQLNEKKKDILTYRSINRLKFKDCAEIMDITETNARVLHHRTIEKSKNILEKL